METIITLANMDGVSVADELRPNFDLISRLVEHIVQTKPCGAILIFLPGWSEILKTTDAIQLCATVSRNPTSFRVLPLHSSVSPQEQRKVFVRPPRGVWQVIVSTNITETSVTIDDILYVSDSGMSKEKAFDAHTGMSSLSTRWVAQANAKQRMGRAGRVQRGTCYRLYSRARFATMAGFQSPEMLRTPLEEICLQVKLLRLDQGPLTGAQKANSGKGTRNKGESKRRGVRGFLALALDPPSVAMVSAVDIGQQKQLLTMCCGGVVVVVVRWTSRWPSL
jgi:ATP-dependent RNA helicase DHX36